MTELRPKSQSAPFTMATFAFTLGVVGFLLTSLWCATVYLNGDRANAVLLMLAILVDLLAVVFGLLVIAVGSGKATWVGLKRGVFALLPAVMLLFSPLLVFVAALILQTGS